MIVGVGQIELYFPQSNSLKEKRFALRSLKTKIRNKFNVSISEIDNIDKWQRVTLGVAFISNQRKFIDQTMTQIINLIDQDGRIEVLDHFIEIM